MAYKVQTIAGMTEEAAAVLNRKGIKYAEQLLEVVRTPAERRTLAVETGVDEKAVLRWANHVDLMRIHGEKQHPAILAPINTTENGDCSTI